MAGSALPGAVWGLWASLLFTPAVLSAGVKTTERAVCYLFVLTRPVGGYYSAWANDSRVCFCVEPIY